MFGFFKKLFGLPTEAEKAATKVNPVIARTEASKVEAKASQPKDKKPTKDKKPAKPRKNAKKQA